MSEEEDLREDEGEDVDALVDDELFISPYPITKSSLYSHMRERIEDSDEEAGDRLAESIVEEVYVICRKDELLEVLQEAVVKRVGEIAQAVLDAHAGQSPTLDTGNYATPFPVKSRG